MTITENSWATYIERLRKVNDAAAGKILSWLERYGYPTDQNRINALLDYAYGISTKYGEAATALACEMYDGIAAASGVILPAAVPAATATMEEVAVTVVGTGKTGNNEIISSAVGRLVKRAGVDTMMNNAIRDGAEWAWIPAGDTCAFCIALASRGWQTASRKALRNGHAEHIHSNCDCTYAVRFNERTNVAGYDPDRYYELYANADKGGSPTDKINAMRREFYAENRERINAQKRDAYAKRKEREASAAEELDV